jgi:hypothetical protein
MGEMHKHKHEDYISNLNSKPLIFSNKIQMNRFRIPDDDEIKICPPNFPTQIRTPLDYHTCYDGDIQRFLTRENPQLPLCLQVSIEEALGTLEQWNSTFVS